MCIHIVAVLPTQLVAVCVCVCAHAILDLVSIEMANSFSQRSHNLSDKLIAACVYRQTMASIGQLTIVAICVASSAVRRGGRRGKEKEGEEVPVPPPRRKRKKKPMMERQASLDDLDVSLPC